MVPGREIKLARLAPAADDLVVLGGGANRSARMRHVRHGHEQLSLLGLDLFDTCLELGDLFA